MNPKYLLLASLVAAGPASAIVDGTDGPFYHYSNGYTQPIISPSLVDCVPGSRCVLVTGSKQLTAREVQTQSTQLKPIRLA